MNSSDYDMVSPDTTNVGKTGYEAVAKEDLDVIITIIFKWVQGT